MKVIELAEKRCSIRSYKPDLTPEGIERLVLLPLGVPNTKGGDKICTPQSEVVRCEQW